MEFTWMRALAFASDSSLINIMERGKMNMTQQRRKQIQHIANVYMDLKEATGWTTAKKLNWIDLNGTEHKFTYFLKNISWLSDCVV